MAMSIFNQNYDEIKQRCLRERTHFVDEWFPTTSGLQSNTQWLRPQQIHGDPRFIVDGATRFDVHQRGQLGDCWFVASVAAICAPHVANQHPQLFMQVVPDGQNFQAGNYAGIFRFRFRSEKYNGWIEVVVDDQLPCDANRKLIYLRNHDEPNEFWGPLLEKAYAKYCAWCEWGRTQIFNPSHAILDGGYTEMALRELTGGEILSRKIITSNQDDIWKLMDDAFKRGCPMTCDTRQAKTHPSSGIFMKHAYTITELAEFRLAHSTSPVRIVRVRNPWGNEIEWEQGWSDSSAEWKQVSDAIRDEYHVVAADGEFWMSVSDFAVNFCYLIICFPPGSNIPPSVTSPPARSIPAPVTSPIASPPPGSTQPPIGKGQRKKSKCPIS